MTHAAVLGGLLTGGAYIFGMFIGGMLEARRWRSNADAIQRIESKGKLFKVYHDGGMLP